MRIQFFTFVACLTLINHGKLLAQEQERPVNNSYTAFTIPEKDLLPESIAFDPITESFFIGSTRKGKIVKISKNGTISDFVLPKQNGLWMVIGVKIDVERRILWVCSSGGDNLEGYVLKDETHGRPAGIFKFDLDTGKLTNKYVLESPGEVHFFNDLAINTKGDVFISHMFSESAIYKISHDQDQLVKMYTTEFIKYPNGLTFSSNEAMLYVAHAEGIAAIDIAAGEIHPIGTPEGLKISRRESIDGLYCYGNSLIGIQPDIKTVQQFHLDPSGTSITKTTALEIGHPMMNNPTTGELVGNTLYYISNAQFGSFNEDGSLFPLNRLYEPTILKIELQDY